VFNVSYIPSIESSFIFTKKVVAQLRCTGVEEDGRRMGEVALGHEAIGFDGAVDVRVVNTNGDTDKHALRTFGDTIGCGE